MSARLRLLRWANCFALVNAAVLAVIGLLYLWYYSALSPSVSWGYALVAYLGQLAVFAYAPVLLLFPVIARRVSTPT